MISVVIPTYNEEANLEKTLRQFERQTIGRKNFELIIVDGGSKDRTREIAAKYADKVILQKSKGIGGARNDGVAASKYDLVATTDADMRIPPDWLERIVKDFEDPTVIAVCGADGPIEKSLKPAVIFFLARNGIHLFSYLGMYFMGGGNSAFRKEVFQRIGGYRDLPHSDDFEIGLRLRKVGKIKYDRKVYVEFSTRRLEKNGYLKTLWTWHKGGTLLMLGRDLKPKENYAKQEY